MSLAKQYAELMEDQRKVLTLRQEMIKVRKQQLELWALKARRMDAEDVAALVEKTYLGYFESEELALDFLLKSLQEAQAEGTRIVAQWEAELAARKGASNG